MDFNFTCYCPIHRVKMFILIFKILYGRRPRPIPVIAESAMKNFLARGAKNVHKIKYVPVNFRINQQK